MLQGRFISLVPLDAAHAADLFASAARPEIWRYMPLRGFSTIGDLERWIAASRDAADAGTEEAFAIVDATGTAIGSTRYMNIKPLERAVEIGWTWLAPEHQRTPANTEAKFLLLREAFEVRDYLRVSFYTDAQNGRSRAALVRLGAVYEGTLRSHRARALNGFERDSAVYSIIAPEWRKVRTDLERRLARPPRFATALINRTAP
ncbi:MAG: GNAT family protein [Vulcanimicrobiaceae bacterium]